MKIVDLISKFLFEKEFTNETIMFTLKQQQIKIYSADDSIFGYSSLIRTIVVTDKSIVIGYSIFGLFEIFKFGIKIYFKEYENIKNNDKFIKSINEETEDIVIKFKAPLSDFFLYIKKEANSKIQKKVFKYIEETFKS